MLLPLGSLSHFGVRSLLLTLPCLYNSHHAFPFLFFCCLLFLFTFLFGFVHSYTFFFSLPFLSFHQFYFAVGLGRSHMLSALPRFHAFYNTLLGQFLYLSHSLCCFFSFSVSFYFCVLFLSFTPLCFVFCLLSSLSLLPLYHLPLFLLHSLFSHKFLPLIFFLTVLLSLFTTTCCTLKLSLIIHSQFFIPCICLSLLTHSFACYCYYSPPIYGCLTTYLVLYRFFYLGWFSSLHFCFWVSFSFSICMRTGCTHASSSLLFSLFFSCTTFCTLASFSYIWVWFWVHCTLDFWRTGFTHTHTWVLPLSYFLQVLACMHAHTHTYMLLSSLHCTFSFSLFLFLHVSFFSLFLSLLSHTLQDFTTHIHTVHGFSFGFFLQHSFFFPHSLSHSSHLLSPLYLSSSFYIPSLTFYTGYTHCTVYFLRLFLAARLRAAHSNIYFLSPLLNMLLRDCLTLIIYHQTYMHMGSFCFCLYILFI